MKKQPKEPETKMAKLMYVIDQMDTFLHPRVMDALKKCVWDARTEMAQEAKDQKISKELQELEPLLEDFRKYIELYTRGGASPKYLWQMRPLFKKIIELYGNQS